MSSCSGKCSNCKKSLKVEIKNVAKLDGKQPQIAYFNGSNSIKGTPDAVAGAGETVPTQQILFKSLNTPAEPVVSFQDDTDTGMYRITENTIGFSTGGVRKVGIYNTDISPYIKGLNVGTSADIVGIRRLSNVPNNSWEDGHLGNSKSLVFTPSDFISGNTNTSLYIQSSNPDPGSGTSRWYGVTSESGESPILIAQKVIPKGFVINGDSTITIYTPGVSIMSTLCYVSGQSVDISGVSVLENLLSSAVFNTNNPTTLNGGDKLTGDGEKMVTIYWKPGVPLTTSNSVSGAVITMERV